MLEKGEQGIERLVTFSRIAFDAGERDLGVKILSNLISKYLANLDFEIHELLLPTAQRYDSINPGSNIKEWLFSSILEQCIVKHSYSSYFTQGASLPLYEKLITLGFISEDMQKRYHLVKTAFTG